MLRPRMRVSGLGGGIVPGQGAAAKEKFELLVQADKVKMEAGGIAYHLGLNKDVNEAARRLLRLKSGLLLTNILQSMDTRDPENKSGGESSSSSSSSGSVVGGGKSSSSSASTKDVKGKSPFEEASREVAEYQHCKNWIAGFFWVVLMGLWMALGYDLTAEDGKGLHTWLLGCAPWKNNFKGPQTMEGLLKNGDRFWGYIIEGGLQDFATTTLKIKVEDVPKTFGDFLGVALDFVYEFCGNSTTVFGNLTEQVHWFIWRGFFGVRAVSLRMVMSYFWFLGDEGAKILLDVVGAELCLPDGSLLAAEYLSTTKFETKRKIDNLISSAQERWPDNDYHSVLRKLLDTARARPQTGENGEWPKCEEEGCDKYMCAGGEKRCCVFHGGGKLCQGTEGKGCPRKNSVQWGGLPLCISCGGGKLCQGKDDKGCPGKNSVQWGGLPLCLSCGGGKFCQGQNGESCTRRPVRGKDQCSSCAGGKLCQGTGQNGESCTRRPVRGKDQCSSCAGGKLCQGTGKDGEGCTKRPGPYFSCEGGKLCQGPGKDGEGCTKRPVTGGLSDRCFSCGGGKRCQGMGEDGNGCPNKPCSWSEEGFCLACLRARLPPASTPAKRKLDKNC